MLDIKFIEKNKEEVKKAVSDKQIDLDIESLLEVNQKRKDLLGQIEELRSQRNKKLKQTGKDESPEKESIEEGKQIKQKLKELESELREVEVKFRELMLLVPNIPSEDTPIGKSEDDNVEDRRWGNIPEFDFKPKTHMELGKDLDILDLDTGVKTSGFRGYYLKNEATLLHFGVLWYALNKLIQKGFTPFSPPTLVNEFALIGSGHFPSGKEEVYQVASAGKLKKESQTANPKYLVGTSEPSMLAYYADKTLDQKDLPVKVCGLSQCYRSEAGSYGKDVKGLYRLHEFMKVEQVVICEADIEESNKWLEEMLGISEEILRDLNLPYRILNICTADMGAGKYKMYDIETWMPSRDSYGETHSDSNLTDWQTRRLNIKYNSKSEGKKYAFALNNTAIASPRILIAIMENYQQKDGSIKVPEVLRPYLDGKEEIRRD